MLANVLVVTLPIATATLPPFAGDGSMPFTLPTAPCTSATGMLEAPESEEVPGVEGNHLKVVSDLETIERGDLYTGFKGTMEYIPYEYATEGSYRAWDHTVWCFGVMLHFLCLMKYPFVKDEDIVRHKLNYDQIHKLPPEFGNLILDCLHKDPEKRPRNLLKRLKNLQ
jgi:serine/threonine protein kinase